MKLLVLFLLAKLPFKLLVILVAVAVITQQDFITIVTALAAFLLPLALKLWPKSWDSARMALVAHGGSAVLALTDLYLTGQLADFNGETAALKIGAYIGLTQLFYSLFKDPWKLQDPPVASGAPPLSGIKPPP